MFRRGAVIGKNKTVICYLLSLSSRSRGKKLFLRREAERPRVRACRRAAGGARAC